MRLLADVVSLMDVAIKFRSSYLDPETKEVVLEGRKIASRYVRGLLWADLLSSFPDRIVQSMVTKNRFQKYSEASLPDSRAFESFRRWLTKSRLLNEKMLFEIMLKVIQAFEHQSSLQFFLSFFKDRSSSITKAFTKKILRLCSKT